MRQCAFFAVLPAAEFASLKKLASFKLGEIEKQA